MGNKKVEMTSSLSPQQQAIEKLLGTQISGGIQGGVAPYTGAIAANPDALSLAAANMMMNYMNGGAYQLPTMQMGQNYGQPQGQQQPQAGMAANSPRQGYNPFQAR